MNQMHSLMSCEWTVSSRAVELRWPHLQPLRCGLPRAAPRGDPSPDSSGIASLHVLLAVPHLNECSILVLLALGFLLLLFFQEVGV